MSARLTRLLASLLNGAACSGLLAMAATRLRLEFAAHLLADIAIALSLTAFILVITALAVSIEERIRR